MEFCEKKNIGQSSKAFTLPEVIVAMSVLVLVILSSTDLLVSIIRSNNDNVNTLVAYELAQEGLEGMRNIRDSNWLLGAQFNGRIKTITHDVAVWNSLLPVLSGEPRYYSLDYNHFANQGVATNAAAVGLGEISKYAPWTLRELKIDPATGLPELNASRMYNHRLSDNSAQIIYVHNPTPGDEQSIFSRYLKIESLPYVQNGNSDSSKLYRYRVTALVSWNDGGRAREVRLVTELTDWKGGPL